MFFRRGREKREKHHSVYVVQLGKGVLKERKFARANPDHKPSKPCVYVGMTGLTPDERFLNHRKGRKSNRYVHRYGVKLLPRLYKRYNPMSYRAAQKMEVRLAHRLRAKGYAVWQN